jgi:hypothetical protein
MQATHQEQLTTWIDTVSSHLPTLSKPQATVLALWSFVAMLMQTASLSVASLTLAGLLGQKSNTVRQRLREFYKPKQKKKGHQRRDLKVHTCFAPLLTWIIELWPGQQIALALDPTLCRDRFVCLAVSLVYRGGSLPVAWHILPANQEEPWMPHYEQMLTQVRVAIPAGYTVLILTDRGLYSKLLYRHIQTMPAHPFMRITANGLFLPKTAPHTWLALREIVPGPGHYYIGRGTMFKTPRCRLKCTLVVLWEEGYDTPWYLITDLAPEDCDGSYYGLRAWIEQGFRCVKSSGMKWEQSRIRACERMERLWLVYAVSMLWSHAVAGAIETDEEALLELHWSVVDLFDRCEGGRRRRVRRFRLGMLALLILLLRQKPLPMPEALHPDPWPVTTGCQRVFLQSEHPP